MWFDTTRKMFYLGMHSGQLDDGYISSSKWLTGEVLYRPTEFKRRIIKICNTREEALQLEGKLLSTIKDYEFGRKYYNKKIGRNKGITPWNAGTTGLYSEEYRTKISNARKGTATTKGIPNPHAANIGKKYAKHLSKLATGRKRKYREDGSWTWEYPTTSVTEQVGPL